MAARRQRDMEEALAAIWSMRSCLPVTPPSTPEEDNTINSDNSFDTPPSTSSGDNETAGHDETTLPLVTEYIETLADIHASLNTIIDTPSTPSDDESTLLPLVTEHIGILAEMLDSINSIIKT